MSQPRICPSCSCIFHQDFVCTTCGAEKLYDETVRVLREQLAAMTQERDHWREANRTSLAAGDILKEQLIASQAYAVQLREALEACKSRLIGTDEWTAAAYELGRKALSLPQDDTALRQWGAKLLREMADLVSFVDRKTLRRKADELEAGK